MNKTKQALQWLAADPARTQQEAAQRYGIAQPGISAALKRAGRGRPSPQVARERAACAAVADALGATDAAVMIRARGESCGS